MFACRLTIYLGLVALGFYFGKYFGALALPALFYALFYRWKAPKTHRIPHSVTQSRANQVKVVAAAHQTLAISLNADWQTIVKARKKQLNRYHPDKLAANADNNEYKHAEEKVRQINDAFAILEEYYEK